MAPVMLFDKIISFTVSEPLMCVFLRNLPAMNKRIFSNDDDRVLPLTRLSKYFQVISDKTFLRQGHTVGHFKLDIGTVFNNPGKLVFSWGTFIRC